MPYMHQQARNEVVGKVVEDTKHTSEEESVEVVAATVVQARDSRHSNHPNRTSFVRKPQHVRSSSASSLLSTATAKSNTSIASQKSSHHPKASPASGILRTMLLLRRGSTGRKRRHNNHHRQPPQELPSFPLSIQRSSKVALNQNKEDSPCRHRSLLNAHSDTSYGDDSSSSDHSDDLTSKDSFDVQKALQSCSRGTATTCNPTMTKSYSSSSSSLRQAKALSSAHVVAPPEIRRSSALL